MPRTSTLLTLALLACPACAYEEDDDDREFRTTSVGGGTGPGTVFNTNQIADAAFSELVPEADEAGLMVRSVALADATTLARIELSDGELVGLGADDKPHAGAELLASTWWLGVGSWLPQKSMELHEYKVLDGVPHYGFYHRSMLGALSRNCGPGGIPSKTPELARLLPGFRLDESTGVLRRSDAAVFIACLGGAVGKAASWGYFDASDAGAVTRLKVGEQASDELELDELEFDEVIGEDLAFAGPEFDPLARFELAIRVVRADYCYDGTSWTEPGVPLLVEDVWGIRGPSDPEAEIEAVWGADGLLCVGSSRAGADPDCFGGVPDCKQGTSLADYAPEGLFMTRLP